MVMPEHHWNLSDVAEIQPFGVCSDYVKQLKA
jgi:hypothetical protein